MAGRYTQLGQKDSVTVLDGDTVFTGVDMRTDPASLPAGVAAKAVNMQFRLGVAEPRYGFVTQPWARQMGVNFNIDFPFDFTIPLGFGKVYGACTFADPNGHERQILACADFSWELSAFTPPTAVLYPPDVHISAPVTFTQAYQVLILWRGSLANPLQLQTALDFSTVRRWEEIKDETNPDYTSTIPDADTGLYYGNRVWVPYGNAQVAFSDILSYNRYDAELSTIWVNEGDSDILMGLFAYGDNTIVAFKNRSIYAIVGVLPDPATTARTQVITTQRGTVSFNTVTQVGKDLWFLADDGVYAVSQALDNALQAGTEPISAPMDPIIRRINWGAAERAVACYHDTRYFLAVPIDGKNYNNVILVYDLVNQQWAGYWESPVMDVAYFLHIEASGRRRLAFVSGDSSEANLGLVYVMTGNYHDERFGLDEDVETELLTRGYQCGMNLDKQFMNCSIEVATWHGAAAISVVRDGVNEEANLVSYSKDRLKYNLFSKRTYDQSNANNDFLAPFRQDYSVELLPSPGINLGSGVAFGLHQYSSERMRIRQDSRYTQIRIQGTRGRNKVRSISIYAHADLDPIRSTI